MKHSQKLKKFESKFKDFGGKFKKFDGLWFCPSCSRRPPYEAQPRIDPQYLQSRFNVEVL